MLANYEKLWVVSIPLRTPFRGITHREAVIFEGERFAEWSPFLEYEDAEAATWLKAAVSFANEPLPKLNRSEIKTNATLPAVRPDEIQETLEPFGSFETVKIKVAQKGETLEQDLERVREVHRRYPHVKLRLDANGGYSLDQAKILAERLDGLPIEYLEQPLATISELAEFRAWLHGKYLIAADESVRKTLDPQAVISAEAADILMLKVQPLGGITESLRVANLGLDIVVSSALETSLGIAQGAYLAAALPELKYDCGLGTLNLLAGDIAKDSMVPEDSILDVRVPEIDHALLEQFAAASDRVDWWHQRFERCLELLES